MTEQDLNPYQAPQVASPSSKTSVEPSVDYYVDLPYLVVRQGAHLPPRCVVTDAAKPLVYRQTTFQYPNRAFQFAVYRRTCTVVWAVCEEVHRQIRRRSIGKGMVAMGAVLTLFGGTVFATHPIAGLIWIVLTLTCFAFGTVFWFRGRRRPDVAMYRQGYFWIDGISPEFLARLQAEQDSNES